MIEINIKKLQGMRSRALGNPAGARARIESEAMGKIFANLNPKTNTISTALMGIYA